MITVRKFTMTPFEISALSRRVANYRDDPYASPTHQLRKLLGIPLLGA